MEVLEILQAYELLKKHDLVLPNQCEDGNRKDQINQYNKRDDEVNPVVKVFDIEEPSFMDGNILRQKNFLNHLLLKEHNSKGEHQVDSIHQKKDETVRVLEPGLHVEEEDYEDDNSEIGKKIENSDNCGVYGDEV